jgi:lipoate-protein ligase A
MRYLDLTLPTAAENLALDDALLDELENSDAPMPPETLRLWEPARPTVVLGRSSRPEIEVHLDACRAAGVPVLRRCSGGAAIVAGPGCLMYAVTISYEHRPQLRAIDQAHRWVLGKVAGAIGALVPCIAHHGTSDLVMIDAANVARKFSGNSVRCRRRGFLYHGTLLYDFPLEMIERYLAMPPRMPDYRGGRPHESFVANLPLSADALRRAILAAFAAREPCDSWPERRTYELVAEKYGRAEWNE